MTQVTTPGMDFMVKFKKDPIIRELRMEDSPDPRESFLYKLASNDCLHWFQNILLVSSPQDDYVPYYSSRIHPMLLGQDPFAPIVQEMSHKIWSRVSNEYVTRFDVIVEAPKK